jgi:hypothetical protein
LAGTSGSLRANISALHIKAGGTGLNNLVRVKRDQRILLDVEEIFASQLVVFHVASGIHSGSLNLDG